MKEEAVLLERGLMVEVERQARQEMEQMEVRYLLRMIQKLIDIQFRTKHFQCH
jgi:hypothetical protein